VGSVEKEEFKEDKEEGEEKEARRKCNRGQKKH